tara:strand:- start:835 stop:990 length:156 start_codon:yes stop_codon:yes gene_type:complete
MVQKQPIPLNIAKKIFLRLYLGLKQQRNSFYLIKLKNIITNYTKIALKERK